MKIFKCQVYLNFCAKNRDFYNFRFEIFLKVKNELYENDQTELEIKMGKRTSMQNMNCSLDGSIDEPLENQVGLGINASRMSITTQLVMFKFDSLHASFVH